MNLLFAGVILVVLIGCYFFKARASSKVIQQLIEAVEGKRRFLLKESSSKMPNKNLEKLILSVNTLIDDFGMNHSETSGFSNQVEATLSCIQEAVFVLNDEHIIEYANESAERIFNFGREMKSVRLESMLRSTSLLEYLAKFKKSRSNPMEQISIELEGKTLWFEASCSKIAKSNRSSSMATLLVLHEVTRLKELEVMRTDFVANVSHELRTPLTIIKGFSETLVDDYDSLSEEAKIRFANKIKNNAERLHLLVEDLMRLSRLESQPDQLDSSVQAFDKLLYEVKESYTSRLIKTKQTIEVDFDSQINPFAFDRHRINQVYDNLLENVFRYAPEFSAVRLSAYLSEDKSYIICRVSDDGPGVPEKSLPHLFERFYRVDKGRSKEKGGTGLGLSIVKHIILLHGGVVRAESKVGKGTTILFSLPYSHTLED
jgi:two-component system phosphate regulon sensor histidine kinase PhoR